MSPVTSSGLDIDLQGIKVGRGDLEGLDHLRPQAIGVFCFSDMRPLCGVAGYLDWRLCGAISRRIEAGDFAGHVGEVLLLPAEGRLGRQLVFVFGLGAQARCDQAVLRRVGREAFGVMERAGVSSPLFAAAAVYGDKGMETEFTRAVADELGSKVGGVLVEG